MRRFAGNKLLKKKVRGQAVKNALRFTAEIYPIVVAFNLFLGMIFARPQLLNGPFSNSEMKQSRGMGGDVHKITSLFQLDIILQ